jgi:cytidylate kinase
MVVDEGLVELDGTDISSEIRTEEISQAASKVSVHPPVRAALVELQREIGRQASLVTEGRDQGSVVFPDAEHRFFLTASPEERARRRHRDVGGDLNKVRAEMARRDERDRGRDAAPLVVPEGAVQVDTTDLTIDQVIERLLREIGDSTTI